MKLVIIAVIMVISSSSLLAKQAQSEKQAKEAVEFRQSVFKLVKSNVGALGGMARDKVAFDAAVVEKNSHRLAQLSKMIPDYFVVNTSSFDMQTEALPKIWDNMDDFTSKANNFHEAAMALHETAKTGDEGNTKKAIGNLFKTCKSCHDEYKKD